MAEPQQTQTPLSIGDRIKHSRKVNNLSQADLARRVGVSQPAIANWETGVHDPRKLVLAKLADVLDTPLEWLSAGARSAIESDRRPAAAYLRRAIRHVPVIGFEDAARFAFDGAADPHIMAEDYIPITAAPPDLFAVLVIDDDMNLIFPRNTVVVIDYADRSLADGAFCLVHQTPTPALRQWNGDQGLYETVSSTSGRNWRDISGDAQVIGRVLVSIRVH